MTVMVAQDQRNRIHFESLIEDQLLPTNLLDGLFDSNLIVDRHHRHQRGVRADGRLQQLNTPEHTHSSE